MEGGDEDPFGRAGQAKERASEVREREVGEWDCGGCGAGAGAGGEGEEGFGSFGVSD